MDSSIYDNLKSLMAVIRDERTPLANTANRVGTALMAIVDALGLLDSEKQDGATDAFLSKKNDDTAAGVISFLQSISVAGRAVLDGGIQLGNALLLYDSENNAVKVCDRNGAMMNFYATGGVSAFGFSGSDEGGSSSVDVELILQSGVPIATVAGVTLYAPEATSGGGGASTWDELTGKPSWLTATTPAVSTFANDAGYVMSSDLGALASLSTVGTKQITNYAVTNDKIADGAVTETKIADASVSTSKLVDLAVTTAKLADASVIAQKIADAAVTNAKLQYSSMRLWGADVALGASHDGNILLGSNMGVRLTDGTKTAWIKYDSENNALYVVDANGNAVNFYATGGVSAFGFSGSDEGGSSSVDVEQILPNGVLIATINGVNIFAPEGGGASSWAELTGKPAWLTDTKPSVSAFANDAGYITSSALHWYMNANNEVTTDYSVYMEDGLTVNGVFQCGDMFTFNSSGAFKDDVDVEGMLTVYSTAYLWNEVYIGNATHNDSKYLWFAYRGIFFEGEGSTSGNSWYGTLCTHDAYTQKSINLRCFNPYTVIPQLAVGGDYLDGTTLPAYTMNVTGGSYVNGYTVIDGWQRVSSRIETTSAYASAFVLKPYDQAGNVDGYGNIVTPSWKSRIEMYDEGNGIIILDVNSEEYLRLAAANGYIQARKDIKLDDDKALRIGSAYLRWDATNNALYVTGQDGAQINFYATGNLAGFSGLDGGSSELTNVSLTGQLTAASVNTSDIHSDNDIYIDAHGEYIYLNGSTAYVDADGWICSNELHADDRVYVHGGGVLNVGGATNSYNITDFYADGTYVYITINGKRYRFTPSSTTTV